MKIMPPLALLLSLTISTSIFAQSLIADPVEMAITQAVKDDPIWREFIDETLERIALLGDQGIQDLPYADLKKIEIAPDKDFFDYLIIILGSSTAAFGAWGIAEGDYLWGPGFFVGGVTFSVGGTRYAKKQSLEEKYGSNALYISQVVHNLNIDCEDNPDPNCFKSELESALIEHLIVGNPEIQRLQREVLYPSLDEKKLRKAENRLMESLHRQIENVLIFPHILVGKQEWLFERRNEASTKVEQISEARKNQSK